MFKNIYLGDFDAIKKWHGYHDSPDFKRKTKYNYWVRSAGVDVCCECAATKLFNRKLIPGDKYERKVSEMNTINDFRDYITWTIPDFLKQYQID